jgi:hypothetical protein
MADAKSTPNEIEAYKKFKQKTRKIVHDFNREASEIIEKIDDKQAAAIKKKINEHEASF